MRVRAHESSVLGRRPSIRNTAHPRVLWRWSGFVVGCCDDGVMSSTASFGTVAADPGRRLEVLFEELAQLLGAAANNFTTRSLHQRSPRNQGNAGAFHRHADAAVELGDLAPHPHDHAIYAHGAYVASEIASGHLRHR